MRSSAFRPNGEGSCCRNAAKRSAVRLELPEPSEEGARPRDLFDGYAGLADGRFPPGELPGVVARAREARVGGALVVGQSIESSRRAIQVSERFGAEWEVWAAVGVHPAAAASVNEETITALHRMAQARRVRAITAGLDLSPGMPSRRVQELALEAMLQLCQWLDLPIVLQAGVESGTRLSEVLRAHRERFPSGVVHDFNGTPAELEAYLSLDLWISVSGRVTDRREGARVRSVLPEIPSERLLIETDAPHQPPKPHHRWTDRSEPAFLPDVLKEVAHLRHTPAAPLGEVATRNARLLVRQEPS
jgi:TatD DNase family protein